MTKIYRTTLSELKKALREQRPEDVEDALDILDPDGEIEEMIEKIKKRIRSNFISYMKDNPNLDWLKITNRITDELTNKGGGYIDDLIRDIFVELDEDGEFDI